MFTVLDIGCRNAAFIKEFKAMNALKMFCLCGEPDFKGVWDGQVGLIDSMLGRKKIQATYADFKVPADSLDMVTLNAYHPLMPPRGIQAELNRCLKIGGLFISAHPAGFHPDISGEDFKLIFDRRFRDDKKVIFEAEDFGEIIYPASPTIMYRFTTMRTNHNSESYIYRADDPPPSVRVYQRVK
jgi:SAM-dependent methyltransferase